MDLMRPVLGGPVLDLAIYPQKGAPGTPLTHAVIEAEGLQGDRRKKRPVHLVGRECDPDVTRANVFLDVPDEDLRSLVGEDVHVGCVRLRITEIPSNCPGVYADVLRPGELRVGDRLR